MKVARGKYKQYLLGNLSERESSDISLQIISNEAFESEMLIAENELMEDYLDGALSTEEENLFHANFLTCSDRINQLEGLSLLKKYARAKFQINKTHSNPEAPTGGFWKRLKAQISMGLNPATAVLAVLIIVLSAGIIWRLWVFNPPAEMTQLEKEFAEVNLKDLSSPSESANLTNVVLTSGTLLRDSGRAATSVKTEMLTEKVFFRLALPFEITGKDFLKAGLLKDGKPVFTQNQVRIYKSVSGQEVKLFLPKSVLQKGRYQIRLENPQAADSPIIFAFVVE